MSTSLESLVNTEAGKDDNEAQHRVLPSSGHVGSEHLSSSAASVLSSSNDDSIKTESEPKLDASKLQPSDFFFGKTLGEGAYARVVHAKFKKYNYEFAIKIMEKRHIKKENKIKYVMMEKNILSKLNHPFMIRLYYTFQDASYLYLCMDIAHGGQLLGLIDMKRDENEAAGVLETACSESLTRFYIAEILEGLRYLHDSHIIHRDLKPENILLTSKGHLKITDFGTSIIENVASSSSSEDEVSRSSFVGTAEYVSPEVLGNENVTGSCDLWAVGCIIFQMLTGRSPFHAPSEYLTFNAILGHCDGTEPLKYPSSISSVSSSLISALLQGDPNQRLGAGFKEGENNYELLCNHSFFFEPGKDGNSPEKIVISADLADKLAPYIPVPVGQYDMRDGADDDWLSDGDATPIDESTGGSGGSGRDAAAASAAGINLKDNSIDVNSDKNFWDAHLRQGEEYVFAGLVWKRKGLFSKRRQLVLTSAPRLIYFDPGTFELKGEIPWTLEYPVSTFKLNDSSFDVLATSTGRRYHITDTEAGAQMWADLIDAMVQKQIDIKNSGSRKESISSHSKSIDHGVIDNSEHRSRSGSNILPQVDYPNNEIKSAGIDM